MIYFSFLFGCAMFAAICVWPGEVVAQSAIVLRDLTRITDQAIVEFDDAGIVLADGQKLGWEQVLSATVSADRQQEFDRRIQEIGIPIFRLKTRVGNGDWRGAAEIAQSFLSAEALTPTDRDLEYLIQLTMMKSRLVQGNRASAVLAFARAAQLQSSVSDQTLQLVATGRLPERDSELMLSQSILPIWFDKTEAKSVAQDLATLVAQQSAPAPGLLIYLASIKIELDGPPELNSAGRLIESITSTDAEIQAWQIVLKSRIQFKLGNEVRGLAMLESNAEKMSGTARAAAFYYRGGGGQSEESGPGSGGKAVQPSEQPVADAVDIDRSKSELMLLRIPAIDGDRFPDLAAAALYRASQIASLRGHFGDAQKLKEELLSRYPQTYHGVLANKE